MRSTRTLLMVAAVALLVTLPAAAADNGFYLGGSVGEASFTSGDLSGSDFDGDATGYKVFAGGRFLTFAGVEGSYVDFGDIEGSSDTAAASYNADVKGVTLEAVGYLPLGIADVFVKGGVFDWESDLTANGGGSSAIVSGDGTDLVYGLGVQFRIQSFALRAEVEYFDVESADELYMVSVGGSYTF